MSGKDIISFDKLESEKKAKQKQLKGNKVVKK
jgi:hypothetical protein